MGHQGLLKAIEAALTDSPVIGPVTNWSIRSLGTTMLAGFDGDVAAPGSERCAGENRSVQEMPSRSVARSWPSTCSWQPIRKAVKNVPQTETASRLVTNPLICNTFFVNCITPSACTSSLISLLSPDRYLLA